MGDNTTGRGTAARDAALSVRAMVAAAAAMGSTLSKSQVDRDYQEGAPKHSARAFLAWRMAYRELGRTADSRIDKPQAVAKPTAGGASATVPTAADHAIAGPGPRAALAQADQQHGGGGMGGNGGGGGIAGDAGPGAGVGADVDSPADEDEPGGDEHTQEYRKNRAANERLKAERAQIELDELRGRLVRVQDLEQFEFTAGRIVRDRIEMVPPRISADLHALALSLVPEEQRPALAAGLQLHVFERRLEAALREALAAAAKAIEEARRDDDDPD